MADEPLANGRLEIYTLDVGQADAHVIITENGHLNLVDADKTEISSELDTILADRVVPQTKTGNIPIETFVITHFHDDHSAGVRTLHNHGYEIQHAIEPSENRYELCDPETGKPEKGVSDAVFETYAYEMRKHDPESIRQVSEGESLSTGWDAQVVAPPNESGTLRFTSPMTGQNNTLKSTGANANSLAFKTEGEQSVLFMGDVEDTGGLNGETRVIHQHESDESEVDLDADILVLAHHGSDNATSKAFLERVDPERAVISSSIDNDNHHPRDSVLKNLYDQEIEVYWTAVHGTSHINQPVDRSTEQKTELDATNPADLAALKYYCREHEIDPEIIGVLPPELPEATPEWAINAAPMIADTPEQFIDEAIENAESVEKLRQTLSPTPDAHDQLRETVQADRDEHVTTRADVKQNRKTYFDIIDAERAYKRLPLHTRLRANIPPRFGGIEHPLKDVTPSDEFDGPKQFDEVPKAVKNRPAAQHRANGEHVEAAARYTRAAEAAAEDAVDTAKTSETLCHHLRDTPGTHQDFLYAIDTPDAHEKNKSETELFESRERTPQRERTQSQDISLGR